MSDSKHKYPIFVTDIDEVCFDPLYIYIPNYNSFSSTNEMLQYFNDNYIIKIYTKPSLMSNVATICHTLELKDNITTSVESKLHCGIHIKNIQQLEWNKNRGLKQAVIVDKKTNEIVGCPINFKSKDQSKKIIFPENMTKKDFQSVSILKKERKENEIISYYSPEKYMKIIEIKEKFNSIYLQELEPNFFNNFNNYKFYKVKFFTEQQKPIFFSNSQFFTTDIYDFTVLYDSVLIKIELPIIDNYITHACKQIIIQLKDANNCFEENFESKNVNNIDEALNIVKRNGRYLKYFTNKEILENLDIQFFSFIYMIKNLKKIAKYFQKIYWSKLKQYVGYDINSINDNIIVIFDKGAVEEISLLPPKEEIDLSLFDQFEKSVEFIREDINTSSLVNLSSDSSVNIKIECDEANNNSKTFTNLGSSNTKIVNNEPILYNHQFQQIPSNTDNSCTTTELVLGRTLYKRSKQNCLTHEYKGKVGFIGVDKENNKYIATAGHVLHLDYDATTYKHLVCDSCKIYGEEFGKNSTALPHYCTVFAFKEIPSIEFSITIPQKKRITIEKQCHEYICCIARLNQDTKSFFSIEKSIDDYKETQVTANGGIDIGVIKLNEKYHGGYSNRWKIGSETFKITQSSVKNIQTILKFVAVNDIPVFSVFGDGSNITQMKKGKIKRCLSVGEGTMFWVEMEKADEYFFKGYSGSPCVCLISNLMNTALRILISNPNGLHANDCLLLGTLSYGKNDDDDSKETKVIEDDLQLNVKKPYKQGWYSFVKSFKKRYGVTPFDVGN